MSAPANTNELDPLLHPVQVALGVSLSWLSKSRMNGPNRLKNRRTTAPTLTSRQ
jgi:hypothetical protein